MIETGRTAYQNAAAIIYTLPATLRRERLRRGLSLRDAADEAGMSFTALWRIEQGQESTRRNVVSALRWLADSEAR